MEDNKEHIIRIAFVLFLQKSYKAVTLKDIISEAGLSNGTFYYYFNSKEQLFKEVIDFYMLKWTRRIFDNNTKDSLWMFIQNTLIGIENIYDVVSNHTNIKESVNIFAFMFEALRYFPEVREDMIKSSVLELSAWSKAIEVAKKTGEIKSELPNEDIARFFIYTLDGNSMTYTVDNDLKQLKPRIRTLWEGLYKTLKD
jgi:AcrR family transcriptional regulator